ncbi:hypothetical protein BO86DRAFT_358110 [Aspergillus japonicus CBS 114.51]|uniref:DNA replication regulator SLD2 n=2 Tax=Aspergillus TaxID=5052 RepID=A0A2V5H648_ASPV1|nr:hypothetical protein BO86DRAFT_358110 [Aspergillus japonicus CBS 114.51]PYI19659.1 hypothetical protein BO99DRAFT_359560 [Aspergillus violaceofuscus CBS 115571]RAH83703.1 hypothetical protein BO86DRAFT_358110 [Aspergillus japonicus CBS 114.51]
MAPATIPSTATPSSTDLRAELKEWERAFADANGGRKADRSDIKKVPEIAAKYKEYSRLKALETSSTSNPSSRPTENARHHSEKKRKHASPHGPSDNLLNTPRKKPDNAGAGAGAFETPSRKTTSTSHPAEVDPYDSPSVLRRLFSPTTHLSPLKAAIGPTPQRDGKALGLFDLLSESGGSAATPSATRIASLKEASVRTPSRRTKTRKMKSGTMDTIAEEEGEKEAEGEGGEDSEDDDEGSRLGRTPTSSGKKWMLSTLFATPTTWRYATMMDDGSNTGTAVAGGVAAAGGGAEGGPAKATQEPNGPETPSFLRRSTSGRYDTSNITGGLSPMATRKRPQFVGKGLSALVKGLRDMEEEQMEDDMDVLREIEAEQAAMMDAQVADSQAAAAENEGAPVWKKKGQKRTTRKVRMKPVVATSRQSAPELPSFSDEEEEEDGPDGGATAVRETQQLVAPGPLDRSHTEVSDLDDLDSLHTMSEPDLSDFDPDYDEGPQPREKSKSFSEKMKEAIAAGKPPATETPEKPPVRLQTQAKDPEPKQPRARKVNPEAHANYRSLKIRNKNFKGRGGGRFGRRR